MEYIDLTLSRYEDAKSKGLDNYDRDLEDVIDRLIVECDRKITRALKRLEDEDAKAAIAISVSEVTQVMIKCLMAHSFSCHLSPIHHCIFFHSEGLLSHWNCRHLRFLSYQNRSNRSWKKLINMVSVLWLRCFAYCSCCSIFFAVKRIFIVVLVSYDSVVGFFPPEIVLLSNAA